jgi:hypothetical protein
VELRTDVPRLTGEEIQAALVGRLDEYNRRNRLEQYALFMGKAQLLEMTLKGLLQCKYAVDLETSERWTLGRIAAELEQRDLRQDFIALLRSVVEHRNYVAHEFLANRAIERAICGREPTPLADGPLHKGMYELEQIIFLHDWCVTHDAWD